MKAFIFDTETTGLLHTRLLPLDKQPEVIEFYGAFVNLETGRTAKDYHSYFRPMRPVEADITKLTGITNDELKNKTQFKDCADDIKKFIEASPLVIAHNASFDKEIIDIEFERLGGTIIWPRILCTVEATVSMNGYRLSLTNLYQELFGEEFKDAHKAKVDTKALIRICVELYKRGII